MEVRQHCDLLHVLKANPQKIRENGIAIRRSHLCVHDSPRSRKPIASPRDSVVGACVNRWIRLWPFKVLAFERPSIV
jgi:hypothetical protein